MKSNKRIIAILELVFIFPAVLFLAAVGLRAFHTAQMIVTWYAVRGWTLWVLLIGLPFAALVIGCVTLLWNWNEQKPSNKVRWQPALIIIAVTTLVAAVILVVVALHMLAN